MPPETKKTEAEVSAEETAEAKAPVDKVPESKTKQLGEMGQEDADSSDGATDDIGEMASDFLGQTDEPEEVEEPEEAKAPEVPEAIEEGGRSPEPETAAEEEASPPAEAEKPTEEPAAEAAPTEEKPDEEEIDLSALEQPKAPTAEELKAAWLQRREELLPELAKSFALSEEEAAELDSNPGKVLPNMLARAALDSMEQTYYALMQGMPNLVGQMMQAQQVTQMHERAFYQQWPGLKGKDPDMIAGCITAFRQSQKGGCTPEQAIRGGGALAAMQLGIPVDQARGQQQAAPEATAPQQPFRPAGAGNAGAAVAPARRAPANEFEQMAEEYLDET